MKLTPETYNIIAYLIYLPITLVITFWVGKSLHRSGKVFLESMFDQHLQAVLAANDILLIAYYLLNIAYCLIVLSFWPQLTSFNSMLSSLSERFALIVLTLAGIHYTNLIVFTILKNKLETKSNSIV